MPWRSVCWKRPRRAAGRIPEDLALVSFDNITFARVAAVPLTTIDGRTPELGRIAVQLLVDRIEGQGNGPVQQIVLPPSLIVRRSCGAAG